MSTHIVNVVEQGTLYTATPHQVPLVAGDIVEFSNGCKSDFLLVFSSSAGQLLSLAGAIPHVTVAAGSSVFFDIPSAPGGSYCCQILASSAQPAAITCPESSEPPTLTVLAGVSQPVVGLSGVSLSGAGETLVPRTDR